MKELVLKLRIIGTSNEITNLKQLRDTIAETNVELSGAKIGTDEFKRLSNQLADAKALQKQITQEQRIQNKAFESLRFAAGSYREIQATTASLTEKLRHLSVGVNATQEEFDALQKRVQEGKIKLADFDRELSASNQLVGEYDRGIIKAFKDLGLVDIAKKQLTTLESTQQNLINQVNTLEKEYKEAGQAGKKSADVIEAELKQVVTELNKVNASVDSAKKELGTFGSVGSQVSSGLINGFKAVGGALFLGFGAVNVIQKLTETAKEAVVAFKAQQVADEQLKGSLVEVGDQADITFERLKRQAESLQNVSIFSDDTIQQSQKALATFGLTGDEIERLTPLIADFASQTNQDFQTATDAIIRGLAGQERGLRKYDSTLQLTADDTQGNLDKITKSLEKFEGGSERLVNSAEGNAKRTVNLIEDRLEKLGGLLVPFEESANAFKFAIVDGLVSSLEALINPAQKVRDEFEQTKNSVDNLQRNIIPLADRYDELTSKGELNKDEQTELNKIIETIALTVPGAVTAFDEYGKALGINTEAVRKNLEQQQAVLSIKNKENIEEQSEALSEVNEEFDKLNKFLTEANGRYGDLIKRNGQFQTETINARIKAEPEIIVKKILDSDEKIVQLNQRLSELGKEKQGLELYLKELQGIPLEAKNVVKTVATALTDVEKKQLEQFRELVNKKRQTDVALSADELDKLDEALKKAAEKRKQDQEKREQEIEKNANEIIQLMARLGKSLADAQIQSIEDETAREIAKRNQSFEETKANLLDNLREINEAEDEAVKLGAKTREDADAAKQQARIDADNTIRLLTLNHEREVTQIQEDAQVERVEKKLKAISDDLDLIDKEYELKALKIREDIAKTGASAEEKDRLLIQNDLERLRREKELIDEKLNAFTASADETVVVNDEMNEELLLQQQETNTQIAEKERELSEIIFQERLNRFEDMQERAGRVLSQLGEFASAVGDIFQVQAERQISDQDRIQEEIQLRIDALQEKKDTASDADKARLDRQIKYEQSKLKESQKQEEQIKKDAAKKKKGIDITNAIITGAVNAIQAYGVGLQAGFPVGLVLAPALAALSAAFSAIQIGVIAATPLKKGGKLRAAIRNLRKLASGGDITNVSNGFIPRGSGMIVAPRHSQKGVKFEYNGNEYEAEGGELKTNNGKDRYIFTRGVGQDATLRKLALATHGNSFHPGAKMVASLVNQMGGGRSFMSEQGGYLATGGDLLSGNRSVNSASMPQPNIVMSNNRSVDLFGVVEALTQQNILLVQRINQVEQNFNDTKIAVPVDEVTDIQQSKQQSRAAGVF